MVGSTQAAQRYMDWLVDLDSSTDSPLQVVYGIRGNTDLTQRERPNWPGIVSRDLSASGIMPNGF